MVGQVAGQDDMGRVRVAVQRMGQTLLKSLHRIKANDRFASLGDVDIGKDDDLVVVAHAGSLGAPAQRLECFRLKLKPDIFAGIPKGGARDWYVRNR